MDEVIGGAKGPHSKLLCICVSNPSLGFTNIPNIFVFSLVVYMEFNKAMQGEKMVSHR